MADAYDVVLVGGGLAGCLAALALTEARRDVRVALIERAPVLGGNHTWCFHGSDCPERARSFVTPLTVAQWDGYTVRFPGRTRRLRTPYACISSARMHEVVSARAATRPGFVLRLESDVRALSSHEVVLASGERMAAALVIDMRGPEQLPAMPAGYQKFVGLELAVEPGHGLREPVLMDACLPQTDGFRFMYALPFGADRVLLEDTYFSDTPTLREREIEAEVLHYARALGLSIREVVRKERGVLPMPLAPVRPSAAASPVRAGYAGGFFHPVTGYSFPMAVRFACALADSNVWALASSPLRSYADAHARQLGFLAFLTRTMFRWFAPEQRYTVLEHFYRLPEPLIARFYAGELTFFDRIRMFMGAPPRGLSLRRTLGLPSEVMP